MLADFANRTADSTLGPSVTDAFRVDLSQSPVIRLLDASAVSQALPRMGKPSGTPLDDATAREIAQREGAKAVITGEIGPVGKGYVLSTRIVATADGHELVALRETAADESEVIPAIDRLSKRLRERVGESLKSLNNTDRLEQVSTSSLEALKKYSQAVRLDDNGGDPALAAQLLQEAVAADSTFAMAWRKLSVVSRRASLPLSTSLAASQKAYDLRDRLSPLERQLAISNYYTSNEPDVDKAIAAYKAALEIDPTERTSLNNLALMYRSQGPLGRCGGDRLAAPPWSTKAGSRTGTWPSRWRRRAATRGGLRAARCWTASRPGQPRGLMMQALLRSAQGDYAGADSILRGVLKTRSERAYQQVATGDRINIALTQGQLAEAEGWSTEMVGGGKAARGYRARLWNHDRPGGGGPHGAPQAEARPVRRGSPAPGVPPGQHAGRRPALRGAGQTLRRRRAARRGAAVPRARPEVPAA